jgi:hypothetical protein
MVPTTRRRLLQCVGTAFASGVAGCAGVGRPPRLGELAVTNYDTRSHRVDVLLLEDGADDPAYWSSKRVSAAEADVLGTAAFEGYPTDVSSTRLYARLDGQPLSAASRFDFAAHDGDCFGIQLEVDDERRPPDLSVWYTTDTVRCEA